MSKFNQIFEVSVASPDGNAATSASRDSSGAKSIFVALSEYAGSNSSFIDSKGNTFIGRTKVSVSADKSIRIFYCNNPIVGTGHTFSNDQNSDPNFTVMGYDTPIAFKAENGDTTVGSGTSKATGSVTPAQPDSICIAAIAIAGVVPAVNGPFNLEYASAGAGGQSYGIGVATLVQTSAAAANATFTYSSTVDVAVVIECFEVGVTVPTILGGSINGSGDAILVAINCNGGTLTAVNGGSLALGNFLASASTLTGSIVYSNTATGATTVSVPLVSVAGVGQIPVIQGVPSADLLVNFSTGFLQTAAGNSAAGTLTLTNNSTRPDTQGVIWIPTAAGLNFRVDLVTVTPFTLYLPDSQAEDFVLEFANGDAVDPATLARGDQLYARFYNEGDTLIMSQSALYTFPGFANNLGIGIGLMLGI